MTPNLTMLVVYVLGPPLIALVGLALRLRWQTQREKRRRDTLGAFVARLPTRGVIEIHDVRGDGSHLLVRVHHRPGTQGGEP
jgi:hypothetical protein